MRLLCSLMAFDTLPGRREVLTARFFKRQIPASSSLLHYVLVPDRRDNYISQTYLFTGPVDQRRVIAPGPQPSRSFAMFHRLTVVSPVLASRHGRPRGRLHCAPSSGVQPERVSTTSKGKGKGKLGSVYSALS